MATSLLIAIGGGLLYVFVDWISAKSEAIAPYAASIAELGRLAFFAGLLAALIDKVF